VNAVNGVGIGERRKCDVGNGIVIDLILAKINSLHPYRQFYTS
jgi:hypothetical protein